MDCGFRDCCAGPGVVTEPARALELIVLAVLTLSRVEFGVLVRVLPKAGLGVEGGPGLEFLDFLWRNGTSRNSRNLLLGDMLS